MCSSAFFIIPSFCFIPQGEKTQRELLPKEITIDEDFITCKTGKGGEVKRLDDVVKINDFDEFYEIIFPFGKISTNFICQKDLLTKGTIKEFESLFSGKIKKINNKAIRGRFSD